jgi:uncharacterized repeat protein (TIGR02543 family)
MNAANVISSTNTVTLYAVWSSGTGYTVTYNTDGGSAVAPLTKVAWGQSGLTPTTPPTKPGYSFNGWQVSDNGAGAATGAAVTNTTKFSDIAADQDVSGVTLKAIWTEKTYAVNYDTQGGSANPPSLNTVKWADTNLLPIAAPTKTNNTFGGWYTLPNGGAWRSQARRRIPTWWRTTAFFP